MQASRENGTTLRGSSQRASRGCISNYLLVQGPNTPSGASEITHAALHPLLDHRFDRKSCRIYGLPCCYEAPKKTHTKMGFPVRLPKTGFSGFSGFSGYSLSLDGKTGKPGLWKNGKPVKPGFPVFPVFCMWNA